MIKFWRWLYKYAEKQIREYCPPHTDYKCPRCNTWSKVVEPKHVEMTDLGYDITCGQCGKTTMWHALGPAPFPLNWRALETPKDTEGKG